MTINRYSFLIVLFCTTFLKISSMQTPVSLTYCVDLEENLLLEIAKKPSLNAPVEEKDEQNDITSYNPVLVIPLSLTCKKLYSIFLSKISPDQRKSAIAHLHHLYWTTPFTCNGYTLLNNKVGYFKEGKVNKVDTIINAIRKKNSLLEAFGGSNKQDSLILENLVYKMKQEKESPTISSKNSSYLDSARYSVESNNQAITPYCNSSDDENNHSPLNNIFNFGAPNNEDFFEFNHPSPDASDNESTDLFSF